MDLGLAKKTNTFHTTFCQDLLSSLTIIIQIEEKKHIGVCILSKIKMVHYVMIAIFNPWRAYLIISLFVLGCMFKLKL